VAPAGRLGAVCGAGRGIRGDVRGGDGDLVGVDGGRVLPLARDAGFGERAAAAEGVQELGGLCAGSTADGVLPVEQ